MTLPNPNPPAQENQDPPTTDPAPPAPSGDPVPVQVEPQVEPEVLPDPVKDLSEKYERLQNEHNSLAQKIDARETKERRQGRGKHYREFRARQEEQRLQPAPVKGSAKSATHHFRFKHSGGK